MRLTSGCLIFGALLIVSCGEPRRIALEAPVFPPEASSAILLLSADTLHAEELILDATGQVKLSRFEPDLEDVSFRIFALAYQCGPLADLGFAIAGGTIESTRPVVRTPDFVWRSLFEGEEQTEWLELDSVPQNLFPPDPGWSIQEATPCFRFELEESGLVVRDEPVSLLGAIDGSSVLIGSEVLGLKIIAEDGTVSDFQAEALTTTASPPLGAAVVDRSGDLWLYGDEGRLWRGPAAGGRFVAEPSNPRWLSCLPNEPGLFSGRIGRRYAMLEGPGGQKIVITDSSGQVMRFDVSSRTWDATALADGSVGSNGECAYSLATLAATDSGWVVTHKGRGAVLIYSPSQGLVTEAVRSIDVVAFIPDLGIVAGASGTLLLRTAPGMWQDLTETTAAFDAVRILRPFGPAVLFGGQSGVLNQLHGERLCETRAVENIPAITRAAQLGPKALVAVPPERGGAGQSIQILRMGELDDCEPHYP